MRVGDIVIFNQDGKQYMVQHIHPMYGWTEAHPYGHNGERLYNKKPEDFTIIASTWELPDMDVQAFRNVKAATDPPVCPECGFPVLDNMPRLVLKKLNLTVHLEPCLFNMAERAKRERAQRCEHSKGEGLNTDKEI